MYSALDTACKVVNYANEKGWSMSNLKLQKVLYFVQGYYLQMVRKPFFEEEIEAWPYGPVVPNVYEQFQKYGSGCIPVTNEYTVFDYIKWKDETCVYDENVFSKDDLAFIEEVVNKLRRYSASDLVTITHLQSPWKNAIKKGKCSIIHKDCIQEYFDERSKRYS